MADKKDASPTAAEPPAEPMAVAPAGAASATAHAPAGPATTAPATTAPATATSWTRFLTPALALIAALIVGGVGGVLIGQNTASASNASTVRGGFGTGQGPEGGFGGFGDRQGTGTGTGTTGPRGVTAGTITSIDGGTLTLKLADGSTVTVTTSGSTTVTKTDTSTVSDLSTGDTITVIGQTDASGNVTATRIAEGDAGFAGFGGGRPGGAPTASPSN